MKIDRDHYKMCCVFASKDIHSEASLLRLRCFTISDVARWISNNRKLLVTKIEFHSLG